MSKAKMTKAEKIEATLEKALEILGEYYTKHYIDGSDVWRYVSISKKGKVDKGNTGLSKMETEDEFYGEGNTLTIWFDPSRPLESETDGADDLADSIESFYENDLPYKLEKYEKQIREFLSE